MRTGANQMPIELELPEKSTKKRKGYYLPQDIIDYIKDESERLSTVKKDPVSENDVFIAIVRCYQKTSTIDGDGGAAYITSQKDE